MFGGSGQGRAYGPTFTAGDTVGALLNRCGLDVLLILTYACTTRVSVGAWDGQCMHTFNKFVWWW